jgi:hypothetical protein
MLLCPTCGGTSRWKYPFRGKPPSPVYMCATRRRKPGVCTNTLALPVAETDDTVLSVIEGEVLGNAWIEELLTLVANTPDETQWWTRERDRCKRKSTAWWPQSLPVCHPNRSRR